MTTEERGEGAGRRVTDELAELRRFSEVRFAVLEGKVDALTHMNDLEYTRLKEDLGEEEYARKSTDAALKSLFDLVGKMPVPQWFRDLDTNMRHLEDKITEGFHDRKIILNDHEARIKSLESVAEELAEWKKWALRTILTPVLLAILLMVAVTIAAAKGAF